MNYIRFFIILPILLLGVKGICFSQKNTIAIEHSTILSKLLFEEKIDDFYERNSGRISFFYDRTEMKQPIMTSSVRVLYKRKIGDKFQVGLWGRKLVRGLQSYPSFNIVSIQDTAILSDTYGGYDLVYRLKSYELGTFFGYKLFSNKALSLSVGIMPAFDVYDKLEIKSNVLNRFVGISRPTGDQKGHFNSGKEKFWERYNEHIQNELYRMSIYFSGELEYQTLVKGLVLTTSIEVGGSTPLKTDDAAILSFLPDGWIVLASIQFGVAYNF